MYRYKLNWWLADEEKRKVVNLEKYKECFEEAVNYYNEVSKRAKNIKKIEAITFSDAGKELRIILQSEERLGKPSLALQVFSHYLAQNTTMGEFVRNKALFRGSYSELIDHSTTELTESEMIKILVEAVVTGTEKEMIKEVKQVITNYKKD